MSKKEFTEANLKKATDITTACIQLGGLDGKDSHLDAKKLVEMIAEALDDAEIEAYKRIVK